MRRVIFLSGWEAAPTLPALREYSAVILPPSRGPRTSPDGWRERAAGLDVELDASWLVQRDGADPTPPAVRGLFRGCREGVGDAALRRALARLDAEAARSRVVVDFSTAAARCAALRRAGRTIVFTNGVFDVFHVGHLRLLTAARAEGDALVVGVNSDDSARRLKGRARPEVVAATRSVELCVVFDQDDPRGLLRAVRPDVLVKGSEYALDEVVGKRLVEGWGGRVCLVPHLDGWSTTDMIRRLRESRA